MPKPAAHARIIAQKKDRILRATFTGLAQEEDVSRLFEAGTRAHLPAIAIFTAIRTEEALVEQLRILRSGSRWRITREHPEGLVTDDVMVGMEWQIQQGLASSPMGFAPFGTMASSAIRRSRHCRTMMPPRRNVA